MNAHSETGTSAVDFFLSANEAEISSLKQLAENCELVIIVNDLVHQLQRERGLSNIYLQTAGERFADQRNVQLPKTQVAAQAFRRALTRLDIQSQARAALLSHIAVALHGLDHLPVLRPQVAELALTPEESSTEYGHLISSLLQIVFEAADRASSPEISRAMVALFNFMQGKEYAGQERAWAALGFAAGSFPSDLIERLDHLRDTQEQCFSLFSELAVDEQKETWLSLQESKVSRELTQLRDVFHRAGAGTPLPPQISELWYDLATERIDDMQKIETALLTHLETLGHHQIQRAQSAMRLQRQNIDELLDERAHANDGDANSVISGYESNTVQPLYSLIQDQAQRLRDLNTELDKARQSLNDRKVIERAKGQLMRVHKINEDQAYHHLRKAAMERGLPLVKIAEALLQTDI